MREMSPKEDNESNLEVDEVVPHSCDIKKKKN